MVRASVIPWRRALISDRRTTPSIWAVAASTSHRSKPESNAMSGTPNLPRKLAAMGGAYGNLAALQACLTDAADENASIKAFLGDSIGCCGHSNEVVGMIRSGFDLFIAGNHEQQAVARSNSCGCGYSSADDEKISCKAFELATAGLDDESREWLGTWPNEQVVELEGGRILLCHGSPGYTSE